MQRLGNVIQFLYPQATFGPGGNVMIHDHSDGTGIGPHITFWGLAVPQPTQAELDAGLVALQTKETQAATDDTTIKNLVLTVAQTAVGVDVRLLTPAQLRALVIVFLRKEGALNPDGTVRKLVDWVK